jgi:hypothetical protein
VAQGLIDLIRGRLLVRIGSALDEAVSGRVGAASCGWIEGMRSRTGFTSKIRYPPPTVLGRSRRHRDSRAAAMGQHRQSFKAAGDNLIGGVALQANRVSDAAVISG